MASCYGVILAGGLSSRMGTDKAQLHRSGETMLEYSQGLLESLGLNVLISGGEQGMSDLFPQLGPMAGIYTAIKYCESEKLDIDAMLIVPVDMPLLTPQLLQKLVNIGQKSGTAACYTDCYLPLYLPVNNEVKDYLEQLFEENKGNYFPKGPLLKNQPIKDQVFETPGLNKKPRSIKRMLSTLGAKELPAEDVQALSNVNTPEEWDIAKQFINPD